jgi:outer membrane protein assembly factor BamA
MLSGRWLLAVGFWLSVCLTLDIFFNVASAQPIVPDSGKYVNVRSINIEGNRRTKPFIIQRELTFHPGDSILLIDLPKHFEESRQHVLNISLFTDAEVSVGNWFGDSLDVKVRVWERWYTLPGITFDIYDRNFNTWWVEHDRDPRRIQYGIRFLQQNVRGRDEDLTLTALFGFAQRFGAGYNFPYINKQMNLGLRMSASLAQQRQISYDNRFNKERFYLDVDRFVRRTYSAQTEVTYKPGFYFRQQFALGYNYTNVVDTIAELNPEYLGDGNTSQQFLSLRSSTFYDTRDWKAYPFKGYYLEGSIFKTGLGVASDVDLLSFVGIYQHYHQLAKNFYAAYQLKGLYSLPTRQPYYNLSGLGFRGDYVSGYEYYLVSGNAFALTKAQLKYKLFTFNVPVMQLFRKQDVKIPIHVLAKTYFDSGYVVDDSNQEKNYLANAWMTGGGVGIDVATSYDFAMKFEYSLNRRGEKGLFLHFSGAF